MSRRLLVTIAVALLLAVGTAIWLAGARPPVEADATPALDGQPGAAAMDAQLVPIVEAALAASAQATSDAAAADASATAATGVAIDAAKAAAEGREAAAAAQKAARQACRAPSATRACAAAGDGTRYEGTQSCRADGCGPEDYGVFTDPGRGWESQGKWENWSLVLGCDSMKGVVTYCGQQVASEWSGYGISYNANAAAISARWVKGVGQNPLQLDYPTGSRMRGEMADYELDGLGVYERSDGRVLRGRWRAGKLLSGVMTTPSGERVSGAFVDGIARSGTIVFPNGSRFVGTLEDGPELAQPRPATGVLYTPDGGIAHQGVWRNGLPVATD